MKVRFAYKLTAFIASVVALSWFFAGWRAVNEASTLASWSLLVGATVLTLALVGLQAYWIYFEEKSKGSLRKRIDLFERIHDKLGGKSDCLALAAGSDGERKTDE